MTISSTTQKNSYSGNGSTHSFAYGFKIFADADSALKGGAAGSPQRVFHSLVFSLCQIVRV